VKVFLLQAKVNLFLDGSYQLSCPPNSFSFCGVFSVYLLFHLVAKRKLPKAADNIHPSAKNKLKNNKKLFRMYCILPHTHLLFHDASYQISHCVVGSVCTWDSFHMVQTRKY
jgi:hypothetical protein